MITKQRNVRFMRMTGLSLLFLLAVPVASGGPASAGEKQEATAKAKAKRRKKAQKPPPPVCRYWKPFKSTSIRYDYVTGVHSGKGIAYMMCCDRSRRPKSESILISFPPGGQRGSKKIRILFSSKLVDDVMDPDRPGQKASSVKMTRTSVYHDKEVGFVCMNSLFAGPGSAYAKRTLVPAIFSSKTGKPGTWKYHGKLSGEPADYEKKRKGRWIGEGSVVRTIGGWRAYLVGYGPVLAVAESRSLDGPWKFVRKGGKLADILPELRGACFPYVLKVSDSEYHLWVSRKWPAGPLFHFSSEDGLDFKPYGEQPELSAASVGSRAMKGLRAFLSSDGKTIYGLVPFSRRGWVIHQSTMPVGLQPKGLKKKRPATPEKPEG